VARAHSMGSALRRMGGHPRCPRGGLRDRLDLGGTSREWINLGGGAVIIKLRRPATRAVLRDGSEVLIRPIRGADAPALADGFARLSTRSRQLRFLSPKQELSPRELRYLTEVDHHDHEALAAVDRAGGRGLGVARYIRSVDDAQSAEIAITVADEWQGRGLGRELLAWLADRARQEGIRRFTALAAADNVAVARLARAIGAVLRWGEAGTVEYEICLDALPVRG
jgi:RimJ/RimL family protein N-acetyltransferase